MNRSLFPTLVLGGMLALIAPVTPAQAAIVLFEFNGVSTVPGATVHATMGLNDSVTNPANPNFPNFSLADVTSFSVQFNGSYTASGSALPASLSGQMNNGPSPVFASLFVNDSLTTFNPSFNGTNNFQFFGSNGQTWQMATSGFPPIGTTVIGGTGTWTVAAVPIPAALWLFGSGLTAVVGLARGKAKQW